MSASKTGNAVGLSTHFAPAVRSSEKALETEIRLVTHHAVIQGLLHTAGGLVAVLNERRQILAVNDIFLKSMGVTDIKTVLGARPGEAIHCIRSNDLPNGCGTTPYCPTCGAAVAMVVSLSTDRVAEQKCVVSVDGADQIKDLCLKVRSCPIRIDGQRFLLLFLQDITDTERWAAMERAFLHDINNIVGGLHGYCELMDLKGDTQQIRETAGKVKYLSERLAREVLIQRMLSQVGIGDFPVRADIVTPLMVVKELQGLFNGHPAASEKTFAVMEPVPAISLQADLSLLVRVLSNMVMNAFEATEPGGKVELRISLEDDHLAFKVWNAAVIPDAVKLRVFQRHFSTKPEPGRGMGTYVVKFFGEQLLKGRVDFTSSKAQGTVFSLILTL